MEKETKQRKPYNRVWCKLTDYTQEAVMFAISGGDKDGISDFTVAAYESALRMKANGDANGGPGNHTTYTDKWGTHDLGFNIAYYYDPVLDSYAGDRGEWLVGGTTRRYPNCPYQILPMGGWIYDGSRWGREWALTGGTSFPTDNLRAFADALGCGSSPGVFSSYGGYGGDSCGYCC